MVTKQKIIETYLLLGAEKGFDCITLKDIADSVRIKKPSLFSHFQNFKELEEEAIMFSSEALFKSNFTINQKAKDKEEFFVSLINSFIDLFTDFPAISFISMVEQRKTFSPQFSDYSSKINMMIAARLTVAMDYCVQRSWSTISDTDSLAEIITPLIRHLVTTDITDDFMSSVVRTICKILV